MGWFYFKGLLLTSVMLPTTYVIPIYSSLRNLVLRKPVRIMRFVSFSNFLLSYPLALGLELISISASSTRCKLGLYFSVLKTTRQRKQKLKVTPGWYLWGTNNVNQLSRHRWTTVVHIVLKTPNPSTAVIFCNPSGTLTITFTSDNLKVSNHWVVCTKSFNVFFLLYFSRNCCNRSECQT